MNTKLLFLIGAGGHGKIVLDALLLSGFSANAIRIRDGSDALHGMMLLEHRIQVPAISREMTDHLFHLAIGSGDIRRKMFDELSNFNALPFTVLHPSASVSRFSTVDVGVFVAAKAVVAANASIGRCSIVNHGAIIDHDCTVGEFSHIAPNATLAGGVTVGANVLIGAGANILPGIKISDHAIIGAGAVVTTNVGQGETHVGVPAKLKFRS